MNQDDLYVQRKGHHTKDCKSKRACFWCKNRHHTSTCQRDSYKTQSGRDKVDTASKHGKKKNSKWI